jgi:hypothetical protein
MFHKALAEHYAISKTPLARGLKVINTDRAGVPMRCVIAEQSRQPLTNLDPRYTNKAAY